MAGMRSPLTARERAGGGAQCEVSAPGRSAAYGRRPATGPRTAVCRRRGERGDDADAAGTGEMGRLEQDPITDLSDHGMPPAMVPAPTGAARRSAGAPS